jgi:hypothetical protein
MGASRRKVAVQDGEANVARVARAVDDPRAGQHQSDKAEIKKIAGHLVNEARGAWGERMQIGQIASGRAVESRLGLHGHRLRAE